MLVKGAPVDMPHYNKHLKPSFWLKKMMKDDDLKGKSVYMK